jgi:tetratricopeptide (TPR) repeat protein
MKFARNFTDKMQECFSFLKVMQYILRAGRYVGRKDYDQAIQIMSRSLVGSKQDVWVLEMIANCHHWAKNDDLAVETAKKALAYDQNSFGPIKLLSIIFAGRSDYDNATYYMRLGLNNLPEPLPEIPPYYFSVLRFFGIFLPRFKRLSYQAEKDLGNLNQAEEEWNVWAKNYLAWYDATHIGQR